ncbi:MAG: (2Fe-2S) ferredoxin domain-containing protein [Candidatus Brocadiae bacterium]|nr:(2Fe-2S) ferredoxin domain-containing protein [Candidatus Brocadiia bacterium]
MGKKITSREDLAKLREQVKPEVDLRAGPKKVQITVHMGTCGIAAGSREVLSELADQLGRIPQSSNVSFRKSGCLGLCDQEPMMTVTEQSGHSLLYGKLDRQKVREIVREHILGGHPVDGYVVKS